MKPTKKWKIAQSLELKWWKRYLRNKPVHEYLSWKKGYWEHFIKEINAQSILSGAKRILDIGCGPAGIFTILENKEVIAVDPLLNKYEKEIEHFNISNYPNVTFINESLEIYEPKQKFDVVFCLNAINHVSDINMAIKHLVSCLNKDGYLILSIDAHRYHFLKYLFRTIPGDALHPHQYDLKEYKTMLLNNEMKVNDFYLLKPGRIFDYYVLLARF